MNPWTAFCGLWLMWLSWCTADEPKIVCNYPSSAADKVGYTRLEPSEIDPSLCTHLIFSSLLVTENGDVRVLRPKIDLPDNGGKAAIRKFNALRKQNEKLKTLVSTGSAKHLKIAADDSLRKKYVNNVVDFVLRHEFDGFNIFWEDQTTRGGSPDDVENFVLLLKEFRAKFDQHKLILTAKLSGAKRHAKKHYDIPEISKYLDLIILNINCHSTSDPAAGHSSPLYPAARQTSRSERDRNINASIHYWLDRGAPAEKIILGTRFYGISYVLNNSAEHVPGSPVSGPATYELNRGTVAYSEICRLTLQQTWTTVWDEEQHVPYSYAGDQWISYDNVKSLTEKGEYVRAMGLGGVMAWSIDMDEHRGDCGERFPLLNALNRGLRENGTSLVSTSRASPSMGAKIVCYYSRDAIYKYGYERMEPSEVDPNLCTHLIYASVTATEEGEIELKPSVDLPDNRGKAGFQKFNALRKQNKGLKTLVVTGDYGQQYKAFFKILGDASLRSKYANNVVDFLLRNGFDGFNIHWQFPASRDGAPEAVQSFIILLKQLRASFDEHGLILSISVYDFKMYAASYYNISEIASLLDFVVLDIQYHHSSEPTTGHMAPLYAAARETSTLDRNRNLNATVHYWLSQGAPAEKLLLGTRFYGMGYVLNNSAEHAPGSPTVDDKDANLGSPGYNKICLLTAQDGWSTVWDEEQRVPYSFAGKQWLTYNNVRSLTEKGEYVKAMGLGGVAAWSIETDDHWGECGEPYPLLNALNCALRDRGCRSVSPREGLPSTKANATAKVFCYYESWSLSKIGDVSMEISDIDPILCTHLIYAYVGITKDGNVRVLDPWADLPDNKGKAGFQKFNALRKRNSKLKTLVSTGGGNEASAKYSRVAADPSLRSKYVKNVVDFVLQHEFDGFDIFWQYPTQSGRSSDVENFELLLKELRASFDQHKLILTTQLEGVENYARSYYHVPQISEHVDFILLSTRFHDPADQVTGHSAPLYHTARETSSKDLILNTNATVHFWLSEGVPAEKLILGTRLFGMGYVLKNPEEHLPGSMAGGPANLNSGLGYLEYVEICKLITQEGWTTVWDEEQHVPYSYAGNRWITYDDVRSLTEKGKYAKDMGLGGVMAFAINQDDHRGRCGEKFPLLNALNHGLREGGFSSSSTPRVPTSSEISKRITSGSLAPSKEAKIICYYKTWSLTRIGYAQMDPSEIDPNLCTHLIYAFVGITEDAGIRVLNPWVDLDDNKGRGGFQKVNDLREKNEKLKTLVSCGGEDEGSKLYSKIAADPSLRSKFVENAVDFLRYHGFDGLDISWQYPTINGGSPDDVENLALLLKELRKSFDENELILSIKVSGVEHSATGFYDAPQIWKYVDFVTLEMQSHHYSDSATGHIAPLFPSTREISGLDRSLNYHAAVHYWVSQGVPAEKLILGTKFYGMKLVLANAANHLPGSPTSETDGPTLGAGFSEYNLICRLISQEGWTAVWDEEQHASYSYAGNRWASYEDARSMTEKAKYVQAMGLGGVMAFTVDMDDYRGECGEKFPLLKALNRVLRKTAGFDSISKSTVKTISRVHTVADENAKTTCSKVNIKYLRHHQNCAKFWICLKIKDDEFRAEPFECGPGLHFDTSKSTCRSKDLVDCS